MSKVTDKIYPFVPVWLQNIGISMYGYKWQKRRFGGVFDVEYKGYKEREFYTAEQWRDHQTIALRKMLVHAIENVPYYKEAYTKAGYTVEDFKKFELSDLSKLPFLEKNTLRQKGQSDLLATQLEPNGEFYGSSGSTGTPTQILFSTAMHQRWSAGFEARIRNWAGLSRFNARGMIGGRRVVPEGNAKPPYYRYNFIEKQVYYSAYHISTQTAKGYLEAMQKYKLDYMTGYAVGNFVLARFLKEQNLTYPLKAVITSSEKLTAEMRQVFMEVYGCKAYDSYSGVEACGLISECERGSLHISPDMGIFEFINSEGQPAKAGEMAEVVSTGLLNFDQPLIRYRIGDMMKFSDKQCSCGRQMPVIEEIVGRLEDVVVGKDGREMVRFHGIFINLPNVIEGQIIQNGYDDFVINVATSSGITAEEQETILKKMESQLGEVKVTINQLSTIPRGPNGKFKAVISNVKRK
jgi:phenylacetate-CoA ligase